MDGAGPGLRLVRTQRRLPLHLRWLRLLSTMYGRVHCPWSYRRSLFVHLLFLQACILNVYGDRLSLVYMQRYQHCILTGSSPAAPFPGPHAVRSPRVVHMLLMIYMSIAPLQHQVPLHLKGLA